VGRLTQHTGVLPWQQLKDILDREARGGLVASASFAVGAGM